MPGARDRAHRRTLAAVDGQRAHKAAVARGGAEDLLRALADRLGILTEYVDAGGVRRMASRESLEAVLPLWNVPSTREADLRLVLESLEHGAFAQRLEPVHVVWQGKPGHILLKLPLDRVDHTASCKLFLEDGSCRSLDWDLRSAPLTRKVTSRGRDFVEKRLPLPALPQGYHTLEFEQAGRMATSLVICAPVAGYSPPGIEPAWGLFLPMYAAHARQNKGPGSFADWRVFADRVAEAGGRVIGTLPVLAAFLDRPFCEPSPYSPASRLFWNEFYIDFTAAPELSQCPFGRQLLGTTPERPSGDYINYVREYGFRRKILEALTETFFAQPGPRRTDFERFLETKPELLMYARFRAAGEHTGNSWRDWKPRMREGGLQPGDYQETAVRYHLYAQYLAQEQLTGLVRHCRSRGVQFYLDLPVGVHPEGYDTWRYRHLFAGGARTGCPPDLVFTKGQDWGFCPLHPDRLRESRYEYVIDFLRLQMRHTGLLRIDHVMGLHRLYWIPSGMTADHGVYVRYPADEWQAIFNLESHRNQTVLVGENLGTVPPEVNASMERHHLRQMYVAQYEQRPDRRQPLREPPRRSVASVNTHDMPTFAAYWSGADIRDRAELGLIRGDEVRRQIRQRAAQREALCAFLRRQRLLGSEPATCGEKGSKPSRAARTTLPGAPEIHAALVKWLARSRAEVLLMNFEDLYGELRPQNMPGTASQRCNWQRRASFVIEDVFSDPEIGQLLKTLSQIRSGAS